MTKGTIQIEVQWYRNSATDIVHANLHKFDITNEDHPGTIDHLFPYDSEAEEDLYRHASDEVEIGLAKMVDIRLDNPPSPD